MNIGGWIFMISSLGLVLGVTFWCYYRVMSDKTPSCDDSSDDTP